MKQFLLPGSYPGLTRVTLGEKDARYLLRVLRLREGDELPAADRDGTNSGSRVTLLQCLPKGRKIDLIVRQATEAGVARIIPLVSAHTIVRVGEDDGRLRRIARKAVQQSGAPRLPLIEEPRELASLAGTGDEWGTALLFHEKPGEAVPLHRLLAGRPREVSVLIGPEGGLTDNEVALLKGAGFQVVHLETGVLRVETAATYALGAVMTILQERKAWKPALDV